MTVEQIYLIVLMVEVALLSVIPWIIIGYVWKAGKTRFTKTIQAEEKILIAQEVTDAFTRLQKEGNGASIIIDLSNDVTPYLVDSQVLDAKISSNLIINIFEGHATPLHDGAMVISKGRIKFAAAYITKLSTKNISERKMGTRHRSALGLSEHCNAIIVVLSEETGNITIFKKGTATALSSTKDLFTRLTEAMQ